LRGHEGVLAYANEASIYFASQGPREYIRQGFGRQDFGAGTPGAVKIVRADRLPGRRASIKVNRV
jgi:hypothetical protein